ncbi:MAG: type III pantothenate kinase [Coriobacteriia bacterium]|nr:type III pantothenate kinase [Coriobacteriia bacterium]
MLLAVDIGNTQTVLGLFEGAQLRYTWRLASVASCTADELRVIVSQLFDEAAKQQSPATSSYSYGPPQIPGAPLAMSHGIQIDHVIIASVVPSLTSAWKELAQSFRTVSVTPAAPYTVQHQTTTIQSGSVTLRSIEPIIVGAEHTNGLVAHLENPAEAGADRIANAVAVTALYGAPAIVLDFGTATNIDVVDSAGRYIGGVISPGIQTSADALFEMAARLPAIDLKQPEPAQILGTTTKTAVQSGLLYGESAKVAGLIHHLRDERPELAAKDVPIVATGGMAPLVVAMISAITNYDEHLTLKGLQIIADGGARPCET